MSRRDNGFGCLVSKGDGKPWMARWMYNRKIYCKSTGEVDKKKAMKVLEKLTRPYRERRAEDVLVNLELRLKRQIAESTAEKLKLADLWKTFAEKLWNDDLAEGTARQYEVAVNVMVEWMTKHKCKLVSDIKAEEAEDYMKHLSESVGAQTYNIRLSLFKRIWKCLGAEYGLVDGLWDSFKKKKAAKTGRRALTAEEIQKIMFAAGHDDMKVLLTLGIYTGLRLGDCALLKWENIDFKMKKISVVPIKTKKHMSGPVVIPMHEALEKMLRKVWKMTEGYVSDWAADAYKSGLLSGYVVDLFKKCGIETSKQVNGKTEIICSFHSLRHTFISNAINAGMSPMLVQRIVGHSTVDMTSAYFHSNEDKMREGISMMPDFVSRCA